MVRNTFAVLLTSERAPIGAQQCAIQRIRMVTKLLEERFSESFFSCVLLGAAATGKHVEAAFEDIRARVNHGDLVIWLFIGHGYNDGRGQGWVLYDGEFSDYRVAACLQGLGEGVEVFVVSDACYGISIARPGPEPDPEPKMLAKQFLDGLAEHSTLLKNRIRSAAKAASGRLNKADNGLVCIASAKVTQRTPVCSPFISELCKAIPKAKSYGELPSIMKDDIENTDWVIEGIPKSLLKLPPLEP